MIIMLVNCLLAISHVLFFSLRNIFLVNKVYVILTELSEVDYHICLCDSSNL